MTKEQLRQSGEAMIAAANGKPIQYCWRRDAESTWWDCGAVSWDFDEKLYRPKPEPKVRPWSKPEDVPLNCWIRWKSNPRHPMMVLGFTDEGMQFAGLGGGKYCTVEWGTVELLEHSTDRKQWAPCTVTED